MWLKHNNFLTSRQYIYHEFPVWKLSDRKHRKILTLFISQLFIKKNIYFEICTREVKEQHLININVNINITIGRGLSIKNRQGKLKSTEMRSTEMTTAI